MERIRKGSETIATKSNKSRLSSKQLQAAQILADPKFSGSITELCTVVDVARSTFYDWMSKEEFRDYVDKLITRYTDAALSKVWKSLLSQIEKGDTQAIKLYFELKGKYKQTVQQEITGIDRFFVEKDD